MPRFQDLSEPLKFAYWVCRETFCEGEFTYDKRLEAELEDGQTLWLVPPDQEDVHQDRHYIWRIQSVDPDMHVLIDSKEATTQEVVGLVPRHWEDWVVRETQIALGFLDEDFVVQIEAEDARVAREMRLARMRLVEELALATVAVQSNVAGDEERDSAWKVRGVSGMLGVHLLWTIYGDHADAREPTGFRELRRLVAPRPGTAVWILERRYPETSEDAPPDIRHEIAPHQVYTYVPEGLRDWVREHTQLALSECESLLKRAMDSPDDDRFGRMRELAGAAHALHDSLHRCT